MSFGTSKELKSDSGSGAWAGADQNTGRVPRDTALFLSRTWLMVHQLGPNEPA